MAKKKKSCESLRENSSSYDSDTEQEYADMLEWEKKAGDVVGWVYCRNVGMRLNIGADNLTYLPDFMVVRKEETCLRLEIIELKVKGEYRNIREARVKFLVASDMYSMIGKLRGWIIYKCKEEYKQKMHGILSDFPWPDDIKWLFLVKTKAGFEVAYHIEGGKIIAKGKGLTTRRKK